MDQELMKEYGNRIREARISLGLTLRDVGKAFEIDVCELSMIEMGKNDYPSFDVDTSTFIDAICHICEKPHKRHPLKGVVFPAYVCPDCAENN